MTKQTFLTFKMDQEFFAVNVVKVLEVLEKQQITKIPQSPDYILGIINFRGNILPVINTRVKFNLPTREIDDMNLIIIYDLSTETKNVSLAATADSVKDVIEIDENEITPVPEMGILYNAKFIKGVIRRNEEFILVLNIDKVFEMNDKEAISINTENAIPMFE